MPEKEFENGKWYLKNNFVSAKKSPTQGWESKFLQPNTLPQVGCFRFRSWCKTSNLELRCILSSHFELNQSYFFFLSFRLSRFWCKENIRGFPKTFDPRFAKSQKFSIEIFLENFKLLVRETEVWKSIQIKLIGTMLILASILILMRKQKSWVLQRKCLPQLQRSESKRVVFQTKCRILSVSYQDLDGKYQGYDTETKFWSSRRNELNTSLWNLCTLMTQLEGRKKLLLEFYNLPSDWILCL